MGRFASLRLFALFLLLLSASPIHAQRDAMLAFNPETGVLVPRADYRATWYPSQPVSGQPTSLGFERQDLSLSAPVWQDGPDALSVTANVRGEFFQTHANLPSTNSPFPQDLWNIRVGTGYRHEFENGWMAGGNLSVGSASDQPFSTIHEMIFGVNAFLRVPQGEHNAWLFTLNYSPTSELPFPIPGIAYFYAPSPELQAAIGFPFASITYHPIDDVTLQLSYALITTIHAKASYRLDGPLSVYAAFDWDNESYFRAARLDDRARLFYYEKRLSAGAKYELNECVVFDLSAGYAFDRFYFEGRHYTDTHFNRVDVGAGPYAAFQARLRF